MSFCTNKGQGVVEAAFLLPIMLVLVLLLVQPAIVLYDLIIMKSAASETCRLLATSEVDVEDFVRSRLSAIPQTEIFHVHDSGCSYEISVAGTGTSQTSTKITNKLKPIPLVDLAFKLFGGGGLITISAESTQTVQPGWVTS